MELELKGRTALVTGASMGIGRAIATELASEGVLVAIAARRIDLLNELAKEIEKEGHTCPCAIETDLYADKAVTLLAKQAEEKLGHVDILVNAAGGSRPISIDATIEQWAEGFMINFFRLRELTHTLISNMKTQRWGRVINISGTSEPLGLNAAVAAKAAVHAWSKGLSREVAKFGITVNSIQPGRILTEQILKLYPTDDSRREFADREIPVGCFGNPSSIGKLAAFLASPLASYITGTIIPVDGGMHRFAF
jgi:3-oxoacyl-[acyl-carrier protein] reductase